MSGIVRRNRPTAADLLAEAIHAWCDENPEAMAAMDSTSTSGNRFLQDAERAFWRICRVEAPQ